MVYRRKDIGLEFLLVIPNYLQLLNENYRTNFCGAASPRYKNGSLFY